MAARTWHISHWPIPRLAYWRWGRLTRVEHRLTSLRLCCAANVVTASEAREVEGYRDCSNRLLECGSVR